MPFPESDANAELEGWLLKWTNIITRYKKRYLVLKNGYLLIYKAKRQESNKILRGTFDVSYVMVTSVNTRKFRISTGVHNYYFKAENEEEKQKWINAIQLAKEKAVRQGESEEPDIQYERGYLYQALKMMEAKFSEMQICNNNMLKETKSILKMADEVKKTNAEVGRVLMQSTENLQYSSDKSITLINEYLALAKDINRRFAQIVGSDLKRIEQLESIVELLGNEQIILEERFKNSLASTDKDSEDNSMDDVFFDAEVGSDKYKITSRMGSNYSSRPSLTAGVNDHAFSVSGIAVPHWNSTELKLFNETPRKPIISRRKRITERPNASLSLWSIIKNNIGKDITKISMPVNFSEPLSFLQRLTEDLEYSVCLDKACSCDNPWERMAWVAAFTISSYSTTVTRCLKPFNPLLGETFECDRVAEYGWRSLAEQVSHHPPVVAMHAQSRDWTLWQEFSMSCKFRGKYIEVVPMGIAHLKIDKYNDLYSWRKVSTTVHNVIVGYLWVENHGEMEIFNHQNGGKCIIDYIPYSYFSSAPQRKVTGVVYDNNGKARYILSGTWSDKVDGAAVIDNNITNANRVMFETDKPKLLWQCNKTPPELAKCYNFTEFAVTLNEMEKGIAPTDSRLRPDQRLMEGAKWDEANRMKVKLEERQRTAKKQLEKEMDENQNQVGYTAKWFKKEKDITNEGSVHVYTGEYWACKAISDWSRCPDIYSVPDD